MTPRVSVIIPAYFSYPTLAACLDGLRAQTYTGFETILINSSPESDTATLMARYPEVLFEQSPRRLYPHAARNRGVELARGELLVHTDPDCRARPNWLERLVAAHDQGHQVVGGAMELAAPGWMECGVHLTKFSWALSGHPAGPHVIVPTANVLYSRTAWERIGPLEGDTFCGDSIQSWRATRAGLAPWFTPDAVVEHIHGGTLRSFWKERYSRSQEFEAARVRFFGGTRGWSAMLAVAAPALLGLVLARAALDAARCGWFWRWAVTLPVQVVGQGGWCAGEARVHARHALGVRT